MFIKNEYNLINIYLIHPYYTSMTHAGQIRSYLTLLLLFSNALVTYPTSFDTIINIYYSLVT